MHTATQTQAKANLTEVTNKLIFCSCTLYFLIDFGVLHCFVARGIVKRLSLESITIS